MATLSSVSQSERYNAFSIERPITVAIAFCLIVIILRSIETFAPGLDQLPDQSILSKVLGLLLVLMYLRMLRKPVSSIGLRSRNFRNAFFIGALSLIILYTILYAFQFYRLSMARETARLVFGAIDKETGAMGSVFFTSFYLIGQLFNAFMEESIFRGIILPHLMLKFPFWKANLLQAFLFGLAHLVFPLSSWLHGQATAGGATAEAVALLVSTTVGGLVFGYLYYRTNSLWTSLFAHLIDNGAGLFFHIQAASRLNAETDILILASIGFICLAILAWIVSKRSNLATFKPWGTE